MNHLMTILKMSEHHVLYTCDAAPTLTGLMNAAARNAVQKDDRARALHRAEQSRFDAEIALVRSVAFNDELELSIGTLMQDSHPGK